MNKKILFLFFISVITLIIKWTAPNYPLFFLKNYQHIIYRFIDKNLRLIFNHFIFSVGDIFYAIIVIYLIYKIVRYIKNKKYIDSLLFIINGCLIFFILFHLFWGFNNYKLSAFDQLNIDKGYSQIELFEQTNKLVEEVNSYQLRIKLNKNDKVVIEKNLGEFNREAILNYQKLPKHLKELIINNKINNVKPSVYSTLLSYTGFSGYFNPFTHENQINYEIPTIGMPITIAHEMSHQLGIASETEANFFGYFVMLQSNDIKLKYAAKLYALKYCLKEVRKENEETFQKLYTKLNKGVQHNIEDTEKFWQSKRNISSYFFKHLYGSFLKVNNQKDGIRSYNKFVDLLINYNKKYELNKIN